MGGVKYRLHHVVSFADLHSILQINDHSFVDSAFAVRSAFICQEHDGSCPHQVVCQMALLTGKSKTANVKFGDGHFHATPINILEV